MDWRVRDVDPIEPTRMGEVVWPSRTETSSSRGSLRIRPALRLATRPARPRVHDGPAAAVTSWSQMPPD
jgi:hypothetical protein